jgi:hypothetical protein
MAFESAVRLSATERVQQRAVKSNSSSMELIVSAASPLSLPGERRQQAIPSIAQKRVSVATRHSAAMPIKRSDVQLGARYAEAVVAFNKTQQELARLEAAKGLIFDSMSQETQQSQVEIPPKYWHAEAALEWIGQGTVKESRTVARAVRLLKNGEFPGKYFDIKVEIAITHALAFGRRAVKPTPRKPPNRRQRRPQLRAAPMDGKLTVATKAPIPNTRSSMRSSRRRSRDSWRSAPRLQHQDASTDAFTLLPRTAHAAPIP